MNNRFLLIAGVPASGKSFFGDWLARNHGYIHVDAEQPGRLGGLGIETAWNRMFQAGDVRGCVAALRTLGQRVVLDWGFPPQALQVVAQLRDHGVELWWFDADHRRARVEFLRRATVPVEAFDIQIRVIRESWDAIRATFAPRILVVLDGDGRRMAPERIWDRMNRGAA